MCAGTAVFPVGQRTTEFQPSFGRFRTVMTHFSVCFADWYAIFPDGEIIFVFYFEAPFHIQVNKWSDVVFTAVNVIRYCIMGRVQELLTDMKIRQESSHSEPGFQKSKGIMF